MKNLLKSKNSKLNNKGYAMAITVVYMFLICSLSVALLSISNIETEYAHNRSISVKEAMQIDAVGYDFVDNGAIDGTYENYNALVKKTNSHVLYVCNKSDGGVRLTVERTDDGKINRWVYGYDN